MFEQDHSSRRDTLSFSDQRVHGTLPQRDHQGLDNRIIRTDEKVGRNEGIIKTRSRLGGFLNYNADNRIMPRQYVLSCFYCVFLRFHIVYAA